MDESINGGPTKWLDGGVQSFALASNPVGVVDLTVGGILHEGYGAADPAGQRSVESFAVGNGGEAVYWLTVGGTLDKSTSGGATQWLDGGIESFALANNAAGFVDLTEGGTLQEGYGVTPLASGVESFAVGNGGQAVYWLTVGGTLDKSTSGGATQWLDGGIESFALANNAAGFVDLTEGGTLQEGYGSTPLASGVESFAVGNGGQAVYWLTVGGILNQSIDDGPGVFGGSSLDGGVQSFALSDGGQALVIHHTNGSLVQVELGYWSKTLEASGVQSFAVGNGGQAVYWLTVGGTLSQSIDDGLGAFSSYGLDGGYGLVGGVQSFAMIDGGMALAVLYTNGVLNEWQPGYWVTTLPGSGVRSFAVGNGGQAVYWLNTAGLLNQSIDDGPNAWGSSAGLSGGVKSFAMIDGGMALAVLNTNGVLNEWQPAYWENTLPGNGVNSIAVGNGGQAVYYLNAAGTLSQSIDDGTGAWGSYALANGVGSFATIDGGMALAVLYTNGVLNEWQPGYWETTLPGGGVQSFAVGNGNQACGSNTAGLLNQSIDDGPNAWGSSLGLSGGVQSFAMIDGGMALVVLNTNGVLNEWQPAYWETTLDKLVYSFQIGAGGQITEDDWFGRNLTDLGIRNLARADYVSDNSLTRADMVGQNDNSGLFGEVEADGVVTGAELHDLQALANSSVLFQSTAPVQNLTWKVVNADPANAHFQRSSLRKFVSGKSSRQLQELVDKWFLGMDHPTAVAPYSSAGSTLVGTAGFVYNDVSQGTLGDCTYLATIAEVAARTNIINSMFTANGDSTWTVRLYFNGQPTYLTVDNQLPSGGGLYDHPYGDIWVALLEKKPWPR